MIFSNQYNNKLVVNNKILPNSTLHGFITKISITYESQLGIC